MRTYYSFNVSYYENPEVDRLLLQARRSVDPDRRRDLYYRVQEAFHEDVPVAPLEIASLHV